jgi:hypothetical protein
MINKNFMFNSIMGALSRVFVIFLFSLVIAFMGLAFYTNVSTDLSLLDETVFTGIGLKKLTTSLTFEAELVEIARFQKEVFKRAPIGDGIPYYTAREPADLMRAGQGLCYDRSRAFDKAATFLGFEARHVYLLFKQDKSFLAAIFTPKQPSHAVTEVMTSKGWMLIDSNTPWMAVTRTGEPVNADDVWNRFDEFENPPPYLKEPWWAIRGMYSRGGHFYRPYIRFPEFNWYDFSVWFVRG